MKIVCSWCKKFMGEKEPYDDLSESHAKCSECIQKQRAANEAAKKIAQSLDVKHLLKREAVILGIVLLAAFLNHSSTPATTFSSFSSSSKISPYGTADSSSFSMNYQLSFFWMIIYGYLIYLFFRIVYVGYKLLQKSKSSRTAGVPAK